MKTELELHQKRYHLYRYPPKSQHDSLQAWDAADEYIYHHIAETSQLQGKPTIILNDDFGSLAILLRKQISQWYSDSKVSHLALHYNWKQNVGEQKAFPCLNSLDSIKTNAELAIIKLPKNNQLLTEQLIKLRHTLPDGALVITSGKANQIQKSTLALFEKHLGTTHTSLAVKKARLIFTQVNKKLATASKFPVSWQCEESKLLVHNHCNVFSANQLDIGARVLIHHLPDCENKTVIDLGCGNGVLATHVMAASFNEKHCNGGLPKKVICVDESFMAVRSAQLTLEANFPASETMLEYIHSNCLEQAEVKDADIVLCNPPFHQQNTITDHIAWQMFNDAKQALRTGGELRIVGNRHLGYHEKLKRIFGGYKQVASNQKFVILSCIKR